jgi:hypothetical protein
MSIAPFTYAHPLGPASPQVGLIEAPSPEIGEVVWGYSTLDRAAPTARPWWHPARNPYLTGGFMAFTVLVALSALREGVGVAIAIVVIGYLVTKGIGALFGGARANTNFFVGRNGMDDVWNRKGEIVRRTFLWRDIAWWGTTAERTNGQLFVRHVQLDSQLRLMNHVDPFGFRFVRDPQADPESAMYAAAHRSWLAQKVSEVSARLANGEAVDMPLLATQNAGRLATGVRPGSFVRVTADSCSARRAAPQC